uniref:Putative secreted protein n=1 Tax=Panstrongylus lignarius TaxID=156445 RepID=A0A224Y167_9HEMI
MSFGFGASKIALIFSSVVCKPSAFTLNPKYSNDSFPISHFFSDTVSPASSKRWSTFINLLQLTKSFTSN